MRTTIAIAASSLLLLIAHPVRAAILYAVDPVHSVVEFGVSHMVISTVRGKFTTFSGTVVRDGGDPAAWAIRGTIDAASIDTGDRERDDHLRGPEFLDAAAYPAITFESGTIRREGDRYVVSGEFSLHGVTRKVEIPFTLKGPITDPWGNRRIGIEASWDLDRRDYGLVWNQTLDNGGLLVGNRVEIDLHIEAVYTPESQETEKGAR